MIFWHQIRATIGTIHCLKARHVEKLWKTQLIVCQRTIPAPTTDCVSGCFWLLWPSRSFLLPSTIAMTSLCTCRGWANSPSSAGAGWLHLNDSPKKCSWKMEVSTIEGGFHQWGIPKMIHQWLVFSRKIPKNEWNPDWFGGSPISGNLHVKFCKMARSKINQSDFKHLRSPTEQSKKSHWPPRSTVWNQS